MADSLELIKRDIKTLKESINYDFQELMKLTREEQKGIRDNLAWCMGELAELVGRLDAAANDSQ